MEHPASQGVAVSSPGISALVCLSTFITVLHKDRVLLDRTLALATGTRDSAGDSGSRSFEVTATMTTQST